MIRDVVKFHYIRHIFPEQDNVGGRYREPELYIELRSAERPGWGLPDGKYYQIYRQRVHFYAEKDDDIRGTLGKALQQLGRRLERDHGQPLVAHLGDGSIRQEGEGEVL